MRVQANHTKPAMMHNLFDFASQNALLVTIFFGLIVAIIVVEIQILTRGFKEVSPILATGLINREDALIIDVNPAAEFQKGHVIHAKNFPHSQFDSALPGLDRHKERTVLVCCKQGQLAPAICKRLVKAGFGKVFMLKGGVSAWQADNLPLSTGRK